MTMQINSIQLRGRQRGAALVVGLIFLVLLSLIGVASMQSTALQERMSASFRDQNQALQAAEASLRVGEQVIFAAMSSGTGDANTLVEPAVENWPTTCPPLDGNDQIPCAGLDASPESMACLDDLPRTQVNLTGVEGEYTFLPVDCNIGRGTGAIVNECSDLDRLEANEQCAQDECKFMVIARGSSQNTSSQAVLQSLYCGPALAPITAS